MIFSLSSRCVTLGLVNKDIARPFEGLELISGRTCFCFSLLFLFIFYFRLVFFLVIAVLFFFSLCSS